MTGRTVSLVVGVTLTTVTTSALSAPKPGSSSGLLLVLPRARIPIFFEQIEEYSRKDGDDNSAVDLYINTGKTYRDSMGRVRRSRRLGTHPVTF